MAAHNLAVRGYSTFASITSNLQSAVLVLCRLAWGWKMVLSGYRHLNHVPDVVAYFTELHIPFPTLSVYVSASTELAGGMLLVLGLATRLISVPLIFNFFVAILTGGSDKVMQLLHGGQILSPARYTAGRLSGLEAIIDDDAFPFLMISLLLMAFGAGKVSIDYLIKRWVSPHRKTQKVLPL
jgi:putative oxidoreductase